MVDTPDEPSEVKLRCVVRMATDADAHRFVHRDLLWECARVRYFEEYHRGERAIIVAELGQEPVGIITVCWKVEDSSQLADGRTTAFIEGFGVKSGFSGQGIGSALFRAAVEAARGRGCSMLTLNVEPSNTEAIAIFNHWGMEPFGEERDDSPDGRLLRFRRWI